MTTVYSANERGAIEDAVRLYIDGVSKGDADKLKTGFHSEAWMFGSVGGHRYDIPISQLIEMATSSPFDGGGNYTARIASVQQVGDAALAIVEEDGVWGWLVLRRLLHAGEGGRILEDRQQDVRPHWRGDAGRLSSAARFRHVRSAT
jgi:Putative lumazine-binding